MRIPNTSRVGAGGHPVFRLAPTSHADVSRLTGNDRCCVPELLERRMLLSGAVESVVVPLAAAQEPFAGSTIKIDADVTSRFELEDFDLGGEGVAYHDTTADNLSGEYRPNEGVDLVTATDVAGGYRLTKVAAGEWTEYTVDVEQAGRYTMDFRVASSKAGGTFHVEVDGADVTGPIAVPNTGSFNAFRTVTKTGVALPAGQHVLRVAYDTNGAGSDSVGGFNWVRVAPEVEQRPFSEDDLAHEIMWDAGGGFALANFDIGGEGVAYHDTTPANLGGAYRPDEGVDLKQIKGASADAIRLSNVAAGEWTEYTINVDNDHVFTLEFRAGQNRSGGRFHAEVDGVDVTGPLTVPNTGSYDTFRTVTRAGVPLVTGLHVFRVSFDRNADGSDSVGGFAGVHFRPAADAVGLPLATTTYVRSGASANTNFGAARELAVKRGNGTDYNRETLVKLDLGALGVDTVSNARLRLTGGLSDGAAAGATVRVAAFGSTNTGWGENSVTWNTRPSTTGGALSTVTVRGTEGQYYDWDITPFVQAQKAAGRTTATIVLKGVDTTEPYARFQSDDDSLQPVLIVTP